MYVFCVVFLGKILIGMRYFGFIYLVVNFWLIFFIDIFNNFVIVFFVCGVVLFNFLGINLILEVFLFVVRFFLLWLYILLCFGCVVCICILLFFVMFGKIKLGV